MGRRMRALKREAAARVLFGSVVANAPAGSAARTLAERALAPPPAAP